MTNLATAPVRLDWLTLRGPRGWMDDKEAAIKRHFLPIGQDWLTPEGLVRSPIFEREEATGELWECCELQARGFPLGLQQHRGEVYCAEWLGGERVGWAQIRYNYPSITLSGKALRRLSWQGAYDTALELWRRIGPMPAELRVTRADAAVEYSAMGFRGPGGVPAAVRKLGDEVGAWMGATAGAAHVQRRWIESSTGVTSEARCDARGWLVRCYHFFGEGVRVELQARGLEVADPHAQTLAVVNQASELFTHLGLPHSVAPGVVLVHPVTGRFVIDQSPASVQELRTLFRRGLGLLLSSVRHDEQLTAQCCKLRDLGEAHFGVRKDTVNEALEARYAEIASRLPPVR